jgi:osomolarity two-component system sensor histidine kinase SLN1
MIYNIINSPEGLDKTGQALIVTPATPINKFPPEFKKFNQLDGADPPSSAEDQLVKYLLPPKNNVSIGVRHPSRGLGDPDFPFPLRDYEAVYDAYVKNNHEINNAGSMLSTYNEAGKLVSVGYAVPSSQICDWVLILEQSHSEVVAPINHLRHILLACVFGTMGGILLVLLPIAHYSVRPIRRLRDATRKSVEPHLSHSDMGSSRSIDSGLGDEVVDGDEENISTTARKEGFMGSLTRWRSGRRKSRAEKQEDNRRRTFRIPGKVQDKKHWIHDELTDLTRTFNEMSEELVMQYERLEERVKERTAELELSKRAAEVANESKTLFIANISHELKTPLNGILGMCAVSMSEDDPVKIKRSLGIIYKSGDLLLHLLTDLLTFSKNQIGQQLTLDEKEFRLADISSQMLSIFDKQASEGQIDLRVNFQGPQVSLTGSSDSPTDRIYGPYGTGKVRDMCLWGDQHRILQVLINLVSNSLKFTPPGGSVEVRIKCLGEQLEESPSRKTSTQSKQSRQHSSRNSKVKGHVKDGSEPSVTASIPSHANGELPKIVDTTLTINVMGSSKHVPQIAIRDRSSSPPPVNSKAFLFEFDVEDTGPGIPENQQQKVFKPFVQGDLGLSKKFGGTGLGLSICEQLANLMKGTISLVSKEGVGSTFSMRIPLRFVKERTESTTSSHVQISRPNSVSGSHKHIENPRTLQRHGSDSDLSLKSTHSNPGIEFNTPVKPRLVGLSQPFFATSAPMESPKKQLEAIVAAEASKAKGNGKVRVLVAEDNKVNQEVVLRMLKLEDIYGEYCLLSA